MAYLKYSFVNFTFFKNPFKKFIVFASIKFIICPDYEDYNSSNVTLFSQFMAIDVKKKCKYANYISKIKNHAIAWFDVTNKIEIQNAVIPKISHHT